MRLLLLRTTPSLGILAALLKPRHKRLPFLWDSGEVIELGNSIYCYSKANLGSLPLFDLLHGRLQQLLPVDQRGEVFG